MTPYCKMQPRRLFLLYVLYHDEASRTYAETFYGSQPYLRYLKIETNKYFESMFFIRHLNEVREEWEDCEYVGMITWKANQKIPSFIVENINNTMSRAKAEDADIVALRPNAHPKELSMLEYANKCHPKFITLWNQLCKHLCYPEEGYTSNSIPAFYCNYWLCKKKWMEKYIDHAQAAHDFMESNEDIQAMINEDSKFHLPQPRNGMTYLTYHCFLMERLPCLFFWWEKAKLKVV